MPTFDDIKKENEGVIVTVLKVDHDKKVQLSHVWTIDRLGKETSDYVTSFSNMYDCPSLTSCAKGFNKLKEAADYYDMLLEEMK